jgi:hypothetical protein
MGFPTVIYAPEGEQYNTYAAELSAAGAKGRWPAGTKMILQDGREFRFGQAGGSTLAPGKLNVAPAVGANFDELVIPAAVAAGSRTVTITNGATTIAANDFAEGYLNVEDDAGEGFLYKIASHTVEAAGSAAVTVTLEAPNGIQTALSTASTVGLAPSLYRNIVIHPSPNVSALVGVSTAPSFTTTRWGWFQTRGVSSVLIDGTVGIGKTVMPSDATDGAVEAWILTEAAPPTEITPMVGTVIEVAATTEYGLIMLNVPGQ